MSCAVERGQFPAWRDDARSEIALALGQIEEAMGALDDNDLQGACEALVRARRLLIVVVVAALYTPAEERKS